MRKFKHLWLNGRIKKRVSHSHQCSMRHIFKYFLSMLSFSTFWQRGPWQDLFLNKCNCIKVDFPFYVPKDTFTWKEIRLEFLNFIYSEYIHFHKEPKENGHSSTAHENWQTLREKCATGRERENVAGNQREDGSHCENHFYRFFTQLYFCRGCHI